MICLRCGYCCKTHMVVIIDDPKLGVSEDNMIARQGGSPCQHLVGDKMGEYSCAIHDYPWYKETPCFSHGQIEQGNTNCRLGEWILKQEPIMNEEIKELTGSNLYNDPISVIHADLVWATGDSMFRSVCPACSTGMLMVKRNQETLKLEAEDNCILCGQQFVYSDIDELRQKAGEA